MKETLLDLIERIKTQSATAHDYRRTMRKIYDEERLKLIGMQREPGAHTLARMDDLLLQAEFLAKLGDECNVCYVVAKNHPKSPDERERIMRIFLDQKLTFRFSHGRITTLIRTSKALHDLAEAIGEKLKTIAWGYVFAHESEAADYVDDFLLDEDYHRWLDEVIADQIDAVLPGGLQGACPSQFMAEPHLQFLVACGIAFNPPQTRKPEEPGMISSHFKLPDVGGLS